MLSSHLGHELNSFDPRLLPTIADFSVKTAQDAMDSEPIMSVIWSADPAMVRLGFGILLAAMITVLAAIDLSRMILPDRLNLMLGAIGLGQDFALGLPRPIDGLLGSLIGAALLAALAASFRKWRGIDGLGLGDQKFVAAAGLWIGWQGLPLMLMVAATSALSFAAARAGHNKEFNALARIPFGPFLGVGTFVAWLLMVTA
jgi:prepilin signal peptidase PulO-like enzyme (type II secretory pathway)